LAKPVIGLEAVECLPELPSLRRPGALVDRPKVAEEVQNRDGCSVQQRQRSLPDAAHVPDERSVDPVGQCGPDKPLGGDLTAEALDRPAPSRGDVSQARSYVHTVARAPLGAQDFRTVAARLEGLHHIAADRPVAIAQRGVKVRESE